MYYKKCELEIHIYNKTYLLSPLLFASYTEYSIFSRNVVIFDFECYVFNILFFVKYCTTRTRKFHHWNHIFYYTEERIFLILLTVFWLKWITIIIIIKISDFVQKVAGHTAKSPGNSRSDQSWGFLTYPCKVLKFHYNKGVVILFFG